MPTLLGMHKRIDNRRMAAMEDELGQLRSQLMQRDAVLWALLKRHGQQKLTIAELGAFGQGCGILCVPSDDSVTFEVTEEKGNEDAVENGKESSGGTPEQADAAKEG